MNRTRRFGPTAAILTLIGALVVFWVAGNFIYAGGILLVCLVVVRDN